MQDLIIIEPGRRERHYWLDLWRYRELFRVLAWRDLSVRYKQTVIGVLWALIRPFLTMVVFTIVFGRIAQLPTDGTAPYALMVFAGILPWTFFSTGLSEASSSLINNANLISKVYFPAADRAHGDGSRGLRGLPDQLLHPGSAHGLVPVYAGLADPGSPRSLSCWHSAPASARPYGSRLSMSSIGIFAMSFRSSCSSACMYRRSASARAWCPSNGGCCIPSIPWWE